MTTLIPSASANVEAYEDMFKEITRKLYGEETGHGLHTLGTPVAHVATGGPTAPEGERSFTTLVRGVLFWARAECRRERFYLGGEGRINASKYGGVGVEGGIRVGIGTNNPTKCIYF